MGSGVGEAVGKGVGVGSGVAVGGTGVDVGATVGMVVAAGANFVVASGDVVGLPHANSKAMADRAISGDGRFMLEKVVKG